MDTLGDNIEKPSAVCRAAGAHLPDEVLRALQVGKVTKEAGEAMHALHGLKGLTTCGDDRTWSEVQNDLVAPSSQPSWPCTTSTPRAPAPPSTTSSTAGREGAARPALRPDGLRTWPSPAPVGRGRGHVRHTSHAGHLLSAQ